MSLELLGENLGNRLHALQIFRKYEAAHMRGTLIVSLTVNEEGAAHTCRPMSNKLASYSNGSDGIYCKMHMNLSEKYSTTTASACAFRLLQL